MFLRLHDGIGISFNFCTQPYRHIIKYLAICMHVNWQCENCEADKYSPSDTTRVTATKVTL